MKYDVPNEMDLSHCWCVWFYGVPVARATLLVNIQLSRPVPVDCDTQACIRYYLILLLKLLFFLAVY